MFEINGIEITMNGRSEIHEISELFASVHWLEEAALADEQLDLAFNHAYCNFLARDKDGKLVGMIRSSYDGMYAVMWNLVVHPDYQRKGVGVTLLTKMIDEMKQRGHTSIVGLAMNHMVPHYEKIGLLAVPNLQVVSTNPKL